MNLVTSFICLWSIVVSSVCSARIPQHAGLVSLGSIDHDIESRQTSSKPVSGLPSHNPGAIDSKCTHGPSTRQCWQKDYGIATNYDAVWPNTGKTVSYFLDVQNITLAPDGFPRTVYAINGQFPGPLIRAAWGDTLQITVRNSLTTNGTSIHWHGIRQWQSNAMDGTGGVTECPIAPGRSRTYTFLCTQFGTSWYHSHYSEQYSDGVVGPIIIDGPATANYDIDLGAYPITDWFYTPAFTLQPLVQYGFLRGPPPGDNILINGTNKNANGAGRYSLTTLSKGKKYRLRLINTSMQDTFQVGLDSHDMTVITADFVPIIPYTTKWLTIGIGQRYDVIITANQPIGSYWFHAVPQTGCANNKNKNALAIFSYEGSSTKFPPASTMTNAPSSIICVDDNSKFVPYLKLDVPKTYTIPGSSELDVGFAITQNAGNQTLVQWNLNKTAMMADWQKPTVQYVLDGNTNYPKSANIISLPKANEWSYWIIQAIDTIAPPQAHPIHLHGHDFYVLGAGTGMFSSSSILKYKNPPRRDVAILPASGWLVIAFITDNPGAWLMHCHVSFHVSLGLGAQFLERATDIAPLIRRAPGWSQQCSSWNRYYKTALYKQQDSGL